MVEKMEGGIFDTQEWGWKKPAHYTFLVKKVSSWTLEVFLQKDH